MTQFLIQNGTLIHAQGQEQADILIQDEQIQTVAPGIVPDSGCQVVDARNQLIFPGVIDPHTHMGIPIKSGASADNFASGSRAALHGGLTTILDFTVLEAHQTLGESLDQRRRLAAEAVCDVGIHINISRFEPQLLEEIPYLIAAGFNSFKIFTTYKEAGMLLSYAEIEKVAAVIARHGGLLMVHAEDDGIISHHSQPYLKRAETHPRFHGLSRPPEAEAVAVRELGEMSLRTGCRIYIVHLNTAKGLEIAAQYPLQVETCPHYLLLDESAYERPDGRMFVASPPLRSLADQTALWEGIRSGQISTVGSDHCPFLIKDKPDSGPFQEIPNGMGGVETLFPTLLAQFLRRDLELSVLTALTSRNTASLFGLDHRKGALAPGMDADLLIVDPRTSPLDWETQLETSLDWNAYAGFPAIFPQTVIRRGELVVSEGRIQTPGPGRILTSGSIGQE